MSPEDFSHLKRRPKKPQWKGAAYPHELRHIATLEVQIAAVREKLAPHLARIDQLKKQRYLIVNRANSRGAYRRGIIPAWRLRKKGKADGAPHAEALAGSERG